MCGKALIEAVDRKLGRCAECPSDLDQALFQQLRDWRTAQAQEQSLPAYVVFTDATLTAIAETRPLDRAGLSRIPGVGSAKLERYADQLLGILAGHTPGAPFDADPGADADVTASDVTASDVTAGADATAGSDATARSDAPAGSDASSATDDPEQETQENPWTADEGA